MTRSYTAVSNPVLSVLFKREGSRNCGRRYVSVGNDLSDGIPGYDPRKSDGSAVGSTRAAVTLCNHLLLVCDWAKRLTKSNHMIINTPQRRRLSCLLLNRR
jgi:hypothetical protein